MRVAIARLSWMSATSLSSPMRWRQQRAQHLVREVVHVLEDRQPRHQPRRQRRAAGRIRIDGSELLLEEAPVDRRCELHHWMIKVDDLVEPRPEEIALSGLPTFIRPHESPRRRPQAAKESRPAPRINLPENLSTTPQPGKYDYFAQPESYSRSGAWEFFTEDSLQPESGHRDIQSRA